ncbi:hypothetical protein [Draconibacterium mangrovi]|uniref:hypothetical protein n=1 Tax=Draconibacterium mangrovi TaxID=2697469 RepID=UPI0013D24924|nr:hypothetical protein [Draconibacterium mangrovi]
MKRKITARVALTLIVGFFVIILSCNSGSKNQSKTVSVDPAPEITIETIGGISEFPPPLQGYAIYLDNNFLIISGDSESNISCFGGSYEINGETVVNTIRYATDPNLIGNTEEWKAELLEQDTFLITLFDEEGNVNRTLKSIRKVYPSALKSQMTDIEGFFTYLPPLQGQAANIAGYYIYLFGQADNTMSANAGTYENHNDTITCKYLYSTTPELVGGEFSWMNQTIVADTFTYAILSDLEEDVPVIGRSLKVK